MAVQPPVICVHVRGERKTNAMSAGLLPTSEIAMLQVYCGQVVGEHIRDDDLVRVRAGIGGCSYCSIQEKQITVFCIWGAALWEASLPLLPGHSIGCVTLYYNLIESLYQTVTERV